MLLNIIEAPRELLVDYIYHYLFEIKMENSLKCKNIQAYVPFVQSDDIIKSWSFWKTLMRE